jgi:hydrogenase maturation protein HypF
MTETPKSLPGERLRVRGQVQGVGFRPTVWRIARELGLDGDVRNDGEGVLIRLFAPAPRVDDFCRRLRVECPPLARIDALERAPIEARPRRAGFHIVESAATEVRTGVVPDAATCPACRAEIADPADRRYRYPFTNCTHCGPRLTIVRAIPYDRANTSMSVFPMCEACAAEYADPADRRFHAQPNACPACGPRLWLEDAQRRVWDPAALGARDAVEAAARLLAQGRIVALKGIGGFHLACDAANGAAVDELRRRKRRFHKPFALMAGDLDRLRNYAQVGDAEACLLESPAAPIVLLDPAPDAPKLAEGIAPGQVALGWMLPYSPLHHLLLADWVRLGGGPLVMTSGNLSDEPQCIDNADAHGRLAQIADALLLHDRAIVNRVDDSVVRVMDGAPRLIRRARGYAPDAIRLPEGFADAPALLAVGGELKNTVCLLRDGQAVLSQHLGDLEDALTAEQFERTVDLYTAIFAHRPERLVADLHPDYRSTRYARDRARREGLPLDTVQHHHGHIASVLADSGWPLDGGAVLGVALDGLGFGEDGTIWGGEFLLADYAVYRRLGRLRPAALPGGAKAILEPWRNAYAQIAATFGWEDFAERWLSLELTAWLRAQPLDMLQTMLARRINSPDSSSCGRLFDAVAAVLGIRREGISYEGQAAIELETLAAAAPRDAGGYPFAISRGEWAELDPAPMWTALFDDLAAGVAPAVIAARFHHGLAEAVAGLAAELASGHGTDTVALSGGVLQNRLLFEALAGKLRGAGLRVLSHRQVPANDGGLSLGQAVVAAARCVQRSG